MSVGDSALVVILAMACVTYATRVAGYLLLQVREPGPYLTRFLEAAPGTLFVAMVTPALASAGPAEWTGAVVCIVAMKRTGQLLVAMALATSCVALLRLL